MRRDLRALAAALLSASLSAPASAMPGAAPLPYAPDRPSTPVIVDPGHGGDDLGAVVKGLREKDITLAVSRKLRGQLQPALPVLLTREDDTYVTLDRRLVDAVDWNGAVFVSVHLNKVKSKKLSGAVVYSYGPEKLRLWRRNRHPSVPPMPAPSRFEARESESLAGAMVKALRQDGFRAEKAKSDYYVLKNPSQPSVLIELGYLSNPEEAARLADPAYQDKLAASLARAIEDFSADRVAYRPAALPAAAVTRR